MQSGIHASADGYLVVVGIVHPQLMVWLVWFLSDRVSFLLSSGKKKIFGFTPVYIFCFNINSEQFYISAIHSFTRTSVKSYIVVVFYMLKLYGIWMASLQLMCSIHIQGLTNHSLNSR